MEQTAASIAGDACLYGWQQVSITGAVISAVGPAALELSASAVGYWIGGNGKSAHVAARSYKEDRKPPVFAALTWRRGTLLVISAPGLANALWRGQHVSCLLLLFARRLSGGDFTSFDLDTSGTISRLLRRSALLKRTWLLGLFTLVGSLHIVLRSIKPFLSASCSMTFRRTVL
jgi:hypothetical protein